MTRPIKIRSEMGKLWLVGGLWLGFYATFTGLATYTLFQYEGAVQWLETADGREALRVWDRLSAAYFGLGAVYLACWRLLYHHPVFRPHYLQWLRTTPWTHKSALPGGSPLPGLPELVLIGVVGVYVALALAPIYAVWALATYGFAYGIIAVWPLAHTGQTAKDDDEHITALILLMGLPVVMPNSVWVVGLASVLILAVACHGIRRRLIQLPQFDEEKPRRDRPGSFIGLSTLEPQPVRRSVKWRESINMCLILGFWAGVINHAVAPEHLPFGLLLLFALSAALIRLGNYIGNRMPPISLVERIRSRRLFISNYDSVFVAPLLAVLSTIGLAGIGLFLPLTPAIVTGAAVFCCMLILTKGGPERSHWQYTSNHRVVLREAAG